MQASPEYAYFSIDSFTYRSQFNVNVNVLKNNVILSSLAINLQCTLTGSQMAGVREKFDVKYPDMGQGRYTSKLNDKDWETFNNYQRVHYNYVESAAQTNVLLGRFRTFILSQFQILNQVHVI
ncbi:hypothetical protein HK098_001890 [Nowakowskiella sp. JEL0407]|nr:hypothetical protein HK098_001890 [Nowakowskiella sp. JEL0407]